ncbi:MAG: septum formation initiator family protein [Maricaulaceae bacterium]|jgi:cell division protein FtsL
MNRVFNVISLVVLAAFAVGLYKAKIEAKDDRAEIARLEEQLQLEQENIRVLRNEISYLESPDRLAEIAREELGLTLVDPLRVVTLEDAPLLIETPQAGRLDRATRSAEYEGEQER